MPCSGVSISSWTMVNKENLGTTSFHSFSLHVASVFKQELGSGDRGGRGMLLGILGEGVPPGYPNPDPISDQKMSFSTPVSDQAPVVQTLSSG